MGLRGPVKQSEALRLARGNPGRRKITSKPIKAPEAKKHNIEKPPSWLSEDAAAKWCEAAETLRQLGVLAEIDRDALGVYAKVFTKWVSLEEYLDEHGESFEVHFREGGVKNVVERPEVQQSRALAKLVLNYQKEFGMTPASRTRLEVQDQGEIEADPLAALLNRAH